MTKINVRYDLGHKKSNLRAKLNRTQDICHFVKGIDICRTFVLNIKTIVMEISNKAHDHRAPVYVFCDNGERSSLVAAELPKLKYSNVKVLEKGFDHWETAYPDLVELEPVGESGEKSAPPPGSGGCGG